MPARNPDRPLHSFAATMLSALILCSGFAAFSTIDSPPAHQQQNAGLLVLPTIEPRRAPLVAAAFSVPASDRAGADDITDAMFDDPRSDYFMSPNSELYVDASGVLHDAAYEIGIGYQPV